MTYRIFTNDVGPWRFGAFKNVEAQSVGMALRIGAKMGLPRRTKLLAIPEDRLKELGPHGQTGEITTEVWREYGVVVK